MARQALVLLISAVLSVTFGARLLEGRQGLAERARLTAEAEAGETLIRRLEARKAMLQRDIALLDEKHLDPDLLDETARAVLGYAAPGDVVLLDP